MQVAKPSADHRIRSIQTCPRAREQALDETFRGAQQIYEESNHKVEVPQGEILE